MEKLVKSILIKGGLQENIGSPKTFELNAQILHFLGYKMINSFNKPCLIFINPGYPSKYDSFMMFHLYNDKRCW
jgi:hypothetical protein